VALAFLVIGILVGLTALRGNYTQVAAQIVKDFTGQSSTTGASAGTTAIFQSFWLWIGLIVVIGFGSKLMHLPQTGKVLIALILVVFVISQKGIFSNFETAFTSVSQGTLSASEQGLTQAADVPGAPNSPSSSSGGQSAAQSGGSGPSSASPATSVSGALSAIKGMIGI